MLRAGTMKKNKKKTCFHGHGKSKPVVFSWEIKFLGTFRSLDFPARCYPPDVYHFCYFDLFMENLIHACKKLYERMENPDLSSVLRFPFST
jgi:hypothetical protein